MGYIEQNLMNGEKIVYRGKLHLIVFIWPVICFAIALIVLISGENTFGLALWFVLFSIATGVVSYINYQTSEYGITNKRVIVKVGFIRRKSLEVLLNKVEGIQVNQGILGRILGFGSITVSGTGGTKDPFYKIDNPFEFRRRTQEQIAVVQDSK